LKTDARQPSVWRREQRARPREEETPRCVSSSQVQQPTSFSFRILRHFSPLPISPERRGMEIVEETFAMYITEKCRQGRSIKGRVYEKGTRERRRDKCPMTERITFSSFYYASRKGSSLTFGCRTRRNDVGRSTYKILTYLSVNRAFPFRYALPERAVLSSLFKKSSIISPVK